MQIDGTRKNLRMWLTEAEKLRRQTNSWGSVIRYLEIRRMVMEHLQIGGEAWESWLRRIERA